MTGDTSQTDAELEDLLAACIEHVENGETAAAETLLRGRPEHEARARKLLAELVGFGIVDPTDADTEAGTAVPTAEATRLTIGRYRIVRELGRGGQGIVYLAQDPSLQRRVAIKVLRDRLLDSDRLVSRFQREAEVASKLRHPGICTVYEADVDDGVPFISMEYLEGETLADRIQASRKAGSSQLVFESHDRPATDTPSTASTTSSRPGLIDVVTVVESLARALHSAHEAGVVHRDVKPSNVILAADRGPVWTDFGLARDEASDDATLTRSGDLFGTPEYMSPEQVGKDLANLDRRTDVWSLGVTLFECATLQRPFESPTSVGLYRAIAEQPAPDPRKRNPGVSRDLAVVIERALEKDRERRYRSALELAEELRRVREQRPILARPAGSLLRLRRWAQRQPAVAASLAAVLLLLVAGLLITSILLADRDRALDQYQQMSDATLVERLLQTHDDLWPARPRTIAAMDEWLRDAKATLAREPLHRSALAELRSRVDSGIATERRVDAWRERVLTDLLEWFEPLRAAVADVEERRDFATDVVRQTIEAPREAWQRCCAMVAEDPRFAGLTLTPQLGLIPLGEDTESGLWEFWVLGTGERPELPSGSAAEFSDQMAIVLVLLPGDGARLEPFFMSKFEMTQAQWQTVMGDNPSYHKAGGSPTGQIQSTSWRNPVEYVTWDQCRRALARHDLELPTEPQWEFAARAGTTTPWSTGQGVESLQGAVNLADQTAAQMTAWNCTREIDDGFIAHAPVGSFLPNAFGLHDVHGNVMEWCVDVWLELGEVPDPSAEFRVQRGGAFDYDAMRCRSTSRFGSPPAEARHNAGVRPARRIQ